jgi:hypothetical protein
VIFRLLSRYLPPCVVRDWVSQFSGYQVDSYSYVTKAGVGYAIPHEVLKLELSNGARIFKMTPAQLVKFSEIVGHCRMDAYQAAVRVGKKITLAKPSACTCVCECVYARVSVCTPV